MNSPDKMTLQATVDQDGANRPTGIDRGSWSECFAWFARILILLTLVAAPWMIGSVQSWSQFWISSTILIALAFWWFETALESRSAQIIPYISGLLFLGILIGLFQILPISGMAGDIFLGRQADLYERFATSIPTASDSLGTASEQRISLNTNGTWHHVRLLVLAFSAMLLSCRYFRTPRDLTIFLAAMTANGVAISIFGLIQKLTWNGKLFWHIELQHGGSPFGPFVNRNNAAGYLLICLACSIGLMYLAISFRRNQGPMPIVSKEIPFWRQFSQQLLYFISELTAVKLATLIAIVFIAAGVLATESRGAILGLLVATLLSILSYGVAKRPKNLTVVLVPLTAAIIALTVWLGFNEEIMKRFESIDSTQQATKWNARVQTWADTWPSVFEMGKLGSGLGTYETVSRLYRTDSENRVFEYAENQYFQALIEAGWPGLIIYLLAWAMAFHYSYFLLRIGQSPATVSVGIVGVFLLWSQAVASFLDFGFYIPANTLAMACTIGVVACFAHSIAHRLKQQSWLRGQFPNQLVQVMLVVVFAATTLVSLDLNRKSRIDDLRAAKVLTRENMDLEAVNERIAANSRLVANSRSVAAYNELGRLWIHRAQLGLFDYYQQQFRVDDSETEKMDQLWNRTMLLNVQQRSEFLKSQSTLSQNAFRNLDTLQTNLTRAKSWYAASLRLSPLQPEVQVVLGQIAGILADIDAASDYLERGIELAPSNANLLRQVAVYYLQANEFEQAAPHLKRSLELAPGDFKLLMSVVDQQMNREGVEPDYELILEKMLPNDPRMIYSFATEYVPDLSDIQKTALEKAEVLLEDVSQSELFVRVLMGKIKLAMGDIDAAIDYFKAAITNNPTDQEARRQLIEVLESQERYVEALEHADELYRSNGKNRVFLQMRDRIQSKLDLQRQPEQ